jgi:hypothetical protein
MLRRFRLLFILWTALLLPLSARAQTPVDLELVLAVDCSGSIDDDEFALQIRGYAAAFSHPGVIAAIRSGEVGAIAVTYVQWSGPYLQRQAIGWTYIDNADSAETFAGLIGGVPRFLNRGGTSISGAIDNVRPLFENNGFEGRRRVIDISGDGTNNSGRLVQYARDDAVADGITINGLAILNEVGGLDRYFEENVIGGPGAFVMAAADFDDFAFAIRNKLIREIAGVPLEIAALRDDQR